NRISPLDSSVKKNYIAFTRPAGGTDHDRHETLGRDAMDAVASGGFARRTRTLQRTAKSCGPGAATVASIRAGLCWCGNGDKKRRSPGRARISRKPLRGESRAVLAVLVV